MNYPKRYFSPRDDGGNDTTHILDIVDALKNNDDISAQEHKERFNAAPALLRETFILQDDGSFLVKKPEESKVMQGHLRDIPIVPGVVLKKLFFHQTQKEKQGIVSTQFLGGAFSGQTIIVRKDGIYNPNGQKLVSVTINTEDDIQSPDHDDTIRFHHMNEPLDHYLLQQNDFRFVDKGGKESVMSNNSHFIGEFTIPENFPWQEEDSSIGEEVLQEIAAQVGAYVTGPDLNKDIPLIQTINEKTQLNPDSKIFTFKSGKTLLSCIPAKAGETIYIKGKVLTFDPNSKEAHFCYRAENKDGESLLTGESKGNIMRLKMLTRAYNGVINSQKTHKQTGI